MVTTIGKSIGTPNLQEITSNTDPSKPDLCKYFEKIRITHAYPAVKKKLNKIRPVMVPFSVVQSGNTSETYPNGESILINDKNLYSDIALSDDKEILIDDKAPSFFKDWKKRSDIDEYFGWKSLKTELRVRTAIDENTLRAKDEQLFAYEMIVPEENYEWNCAIDIDLENIPVDDRSAVLTQIVALLQNGLNGWGKTKVSAKLEINQNKIAPVFESNLNPVDGLWVVSLQTEALLCDPKCLQQTNNDKELYSAYKDIWNEFSNNKLELVRYFATQSLSGGYYLFNRFQADRNKGDKNVYKPYLLTDAGSVFVLKSMTEDNEAVKKKITQWFEHGLPLPNWVNNEYERNDKPGNHWSNCPYVPENGYGEINVNLQYTKSEGNNE